jgi:predicted nucleotidyltransferase
MFESNIAPIRARLIAAGVRKLGVFGSVSRDEATDSSDMDFLVSFEPQFRTFDSLFEVGEALESAFQRRVDLVTEDSLSPYLARQILSEVKYVDLGH